MLEMRMSSTVKACRVVALAIVLLGLLCGFACGSRTESGKLKVVVTIFPLADFVKNVGGDRVEVVTLLPAGASPHTYDLTPGDMKAAAEARLMVINGAGLDFWIVEAVESGADLLVVDTSVIPAVERALLGGDDHEHEGDEQEGHEHGDVNPHIWLDPVLAQKQVEAVAAALVMVDPDNKEFYLDNAAHYIDELEALDEEIRNATQSFSSREFVTFHPAWTYFARRYGLIEAAVIEEAPGKEPTADAIRKVIDTARDLQVKAIFAEPQFSSKAAETIAAESGAEVLFLDPIGGADLEGKDSYLELMRYNVDQMRLAMG
jgi:zinc transport system substrate-binding protein